MTSTADIRTEQVRFDSAGTDLRGTLHLPADMSGPLPAVVVTGTWTSIKQQMADRYAAALASRGFAALSFDFAGFGDSAGDPRDVEDPQAKVRDIRAAVDFVTTHPTVDQGRVHALGVCASAGYTAVNAAADSRVRSLALVAPWLHDSELVTDIYGGADGVATRVAAGEHARERYETTGDVAYVPAVSATNPDAAMPFDIDFYLNPARGGIPAWPNRFAVMSWPLWLRFDPIAAAPHVTQPVLVIHSEDGAIPDGARRFLAALPHPGRAIWTDGTQFDFYDNPAHVTLAADAAAAHFSGHA
jgi:fermentation-respiration switch protein FrsA (DUF1100 family)